MINKCMNFILRSFPYEDHVFELERTLPELFVNKCNKHISELLFLESISIIKILRIIATKNLLLYVYCSFNCFY